MPYPSLCRWGVWAQPQLRLGAEASPTTRSATDTDQDLCRFAGRGCVDVESTSCLDRSRALARALPALGAYAAGKFDLVLWSCRMRGVLRVALSHLMGPLRRKSV